MITNILKNFNLNISLITYHHQEDNSKDINETYQIYADDKDALANFMPEEKEL